MYYESGMSFNSASLKSRPELDVQAVVSFGSALWEGLGESSPRLFICRVGGRGGANRSANREVAGGSGALTGGGGGLRPDREDRTTGAGAALGGVGWGAGAATATGLGAAALTAGALAGL